MRPQPPETSKSNDCTAGDDCKREHNSKKAEVFATWDVDVQRSETSTYVHGEVCDSDNRHHDKNLIHGALGPFELDTKVREIGLL
jgi:hypothetical protein